MNKLINSLCSAIFQRRMAREEAYLSRATDCADLERRLMALDRAA